MFFILQVYEMIFLTCLDAMCCYSLNWTHGYLFKYRLDGMMTGLQDIHCVCSEDPSPCHLTDSNRMSLQLQASIAWESWHDSREYVLLLNVSNIKCNELPNLWLIKYVSCSNQFESTLNSSQYITRYHEFPVAVTCSKLKQYAWINI